MHHSPDHSNSIVVFCRQGNDSQLAVKKLKEKISSLTNDGAEDTEHISKVDRNIQPGERKSILSYKGRAITIVDIKKGLYGWQRHIDHNFPLY